MFVYALWTVKSKPLLRVGAVDLLMPMLLASTPSRPCRALNTVIRSARCLLTRSSTSPNLSSRSLYESDVRGYSCLVKRRCTRSMSLSRPTYIGLHSGLAYSSTGLTYVVNSCLLTPFYSACLFIWLYTRLILPNKVSGGIKFYCLLIS